MGQNLIGEEVSLRFMSDKPAILTSLANLGASASTNNLLPEGEEIYINPAEILVLPRQSDTWRLIATRDAGRDVIKGILKFEDGSELELSLEVFVEE
jgi:hypothetical protein